MALVAASSSANAVSRRQREKEQAVTQIPTVEMPPALKRAVEVRDERVRDLTAAREALHEARLAVDAAVAADRDDYARSRDENKPDPGAVRERAAREHVAECERREAGEALRLAQAEDALTAAVSEYVDEWASKLTRVWRKADATSEAALQRFAEVEAKRAEVRRVAYWLAGVQETGNRSARQRAMSDETGLRDASNAGARLRVPQIVDALHEFVEATSATIHEQGASERIAAREHDARLATLRTHESNEVRAAAVEVDGGAFTIDEAEQVAAGAPLDEIRQRAEQRRAAARPAPVGPWG
jgi:hypothetical protein